MSISLVKATSEYPDLVFCNSKSFKDVLINESIMSLPEKYYANLTLPIDVTFDAVFNNEGRQSSSLFEYKVFIQPTKYNGLCKIFRFDGTMKPKNYLVFRTMQSQKLSLVIMPKNSFVFMIGHEWPNFPPKMIRLHRSTQIEIEIHENIHLPKGTKPCQANSKINTFSDCFKSDVWDYLSSENFDCVPSFFENFLKHYMEKFNLTVCEENSNVAIEKSQEIANFYHSRLLNYSMKESF